MIIHQFSGSPDSRVSFGIYGDDLNPKAITDALKLVPSHAHYKGDYPRNNPKYAQATQGAWIIHSQEANETSLVDRLGGLLALLLPHKEYLLRLPNDYSFRFYCVLYNPHAFDLSPRTLMQIAEIRAELGVTFEDWSR